MSVKYFEDLIRMIARAFYDDFAIVIIEYILHTRSAEEHKMSDEMNLPIGKIRQTLL